VRVEDRFAEGGAGAGAARSPKPRVMLPVLLFLLTIVSTTIAGMAQFGSQTDGLAFSASILSILFSHEMGHYLVARRHGVDASLPHFIPMPPIFMLGTLGAVIGMRTDQATRNQLMDIGAAGPIAGFIVAVPAMILGVYLSQIVPAVSTELEAIFGPSAITGLASFVLPRVSGQFYGDSLLSAGIIRVLRPGLPEGYDLVLNPVLLGAWGGFLVTAINLLPMGQLDGGHVLYAFSPRHAARWAARIHRALNVLGVVGLLVHGPTIVYGLLQAAGAIVGSQIVPVVGPVIATRVVASIGLSGSAIPVEVFETLRPLFPFTSYAFLIWALFGKMTGLRHPPVRQEAEPLTPARRWTAYLCAAILLLTFMPSPAWLDGVWLG
jgi:Zn-dependent protease